MPREHTRETDQLQTAMGAADKVLIKAEKYKAALAAPKGMVPIDDRIKLLRHLDDDDDFFHVSCHIDNNLKTKIQNGEYIDLERLLPRDRSGVLEGNHSEESVLELVSKGGQTYFAPAKDRAKITSVHKWDQAFRVYAAIYSEANLNCSAEIWQYIYVIHRAALVYNWDNVSFYDHTFRQLMVSKPWRSWAKTYTQAWNLAMNDPIARNNFNSGGNAGFKTDGEHDWRDFCCWKFNRNKRKKNNCHYDHRCRYCGGWNHGYYNCRKHLRNSRSNDKSNNAGSAHSSNKQNGSAGNNRQ